MAEGKKFEIGLSGDAIEKLKQLKQGFDDNEDAAESLRGEVDRLTDQVKSLTRELGKVKESGVKTQIDGLVKSFDGVEHAIKTISTSFKTATTASNNATKTMAKGLADVKKMGNLASIGITAAIKDYRVAMRTLNRVEEQMSDRQVGIIERKLARVATGNLSMDEFQKSVRKVSKVYSDELNKRLDISSMNKSQLAYEKNMADIQSKGADKKLVGEAKALAIQKESALKQDALKKKGDEILAQQKEITAQKEKQTAEMKKQQEARTGYEEARQAKAESQKRVAESRERAYKEQEWANELARQQKLEKNQRARQIVYDQMYAMTHGGYDLGDPSAKKLALSTARLRDTIRNIENFAETQGYKGTVGAEATSVLRSEQFYDNIYKMATDWKLVNSEEGKAANTLGRMITDAKDLQSGINRIHTAFGQVSSTVSAIRGIGVELRKTLTSIVQPVLSIVSNLSSTAFKSSLEAMKDLELSEIGFGNFYGESAVSGIIQNIKQEALLSPLSASQLSSYVNQIAPLSKGNSQLAIDATMGVAKMIQYSGGEVATEMEYIIKNLRDVISKGKALTVDIRQFNRAMPALTKVLADMGESEMLKGGELTIDETTAPRLLEAFQKINEFGDVADIFEKTSTTISGLMERLEEQMQLFIIDVGEFSGLTDLIKNTIKDFLEDSNGLLSDLRMNAQFIGRDVTAWLKSRDWERVLGIAKEVASVLWQGLKDSFEILRSALGGTDWRETLVNLAETISSFVKGIANSYSWLLGIMNALNKSGILGSGLIQGGMGLLGFLSGNAGTLITGLTRGFGNFMGGLNQVSFSLISVMESMQAEYLKSATTIDTFDEALLIAVKALSGFGDTILQIDTALGGVLTAEQRAMVQEELSTHQTEMETIATQSHTVAVKANEAAIEREAAARTFSEKTAKISGNSGSGLLGPALKGEGTRLGELLGGALKAVSIGTLVETLASSSISGISEVLGADKYSASNAGNWVGSMGGFAAGGAMLGSTIAPGVGTVVGAVGGALVGAIKAGIEQSGILDQSRKDELDSFKQQVNNGTYLKEILNEINRGNDISSNDFDNINANLVKQMNQWAASTPSGTAQMLKDYLRAIEVNGRNIEQAVEDINKKNDERAETLWQYVEKDDVEGGNNYAAFLQSQGLSSYQISAMIMQGAMGHGKNRDEAINYLLQWGKTNDKAGNDLTSESIAAMNETDKRAIVDQLESAWTEIGMESVQNLDMSSAEKTKIAERMGEAMAKFLTSAFDEMTEKDWLEMNRWLTTAKVGDVAKKLGFEISPQGWDALRDDLLNNNGSRYGATEESLKMWANDYKGHGSEDENGNSLGLSNFYVDSKTVDELTKGMTAQEKWNWLENHFQEIGKSSNDLYNEYVAAKNIANEQKAIDQSSENKLQEIKENTDRIIEQGSVNAALKDSIIQFQETLNNTSLAPKNEANGGIVYLASGGSPRGVDIVPAMLQPGEFVVRRSAVEKVGLSAMNALNTGNLGYFARMVGRQDVYGDYTGAKTWVRNNTSNDNRKSSRIVVNNYTRGARLNRYYALANRF